MSPHVSSYIITAARAGPSAKPTNSDSVNPAGIVFETYPFQESCLLIWDLYKSLLFSFFVQCLLKSFLISLQLLVRGLPLSPPILSLLIQQVYYLKHIS